MAIRRAPRRQLKLDLVYSDQGGVRGFVLARLEAGDRVEEIASVLANACGESLSEDTLYAWIRTWRRQETQEVAA